MEAVGVKRAGSLTTVGENVTARLPSARTDISPSCSRIIECTSGVAGAPSPQAVGELAELSLP